MTVVHAGISEAPLDVAGLHQAVADRASGAVVVFVGVVRDHDAGRSVVGLEYQAHPSAADTVARVAAQIDADYQIVALAVVHRVGVLAVGEPALVAVVGAAHRAAAFAASQALVDQVKAELPVWKRQVFADGTDEWVNCP